MLLVLILPAIGRSDEATTLSGQRTTGRLALAAGDAVTLLQADGGLVRLPARDLSAVELSRGPLLPAEAKYDEVELTDGSTFRATNVRVVGNKLVAEPLPAAGPPAVELPLKAVGWLMRNAHEPKNRADWQTLLAGRGKRDLLVIRQAAGTLTTVPGTVVEGSAAGDRLTFEREGGGRTALPLSRFTGGIVFNQVPQAEVPPTFCRVLDAGGNTWVAAKVELDGDGLAVTTPTGATVRYPSRSTVRSLDFGRGNVVYLSDLPLETNYPPAEKSGPLADQFPYAPLVSLDGDTRAIGQTFAKSLALPADVVLTAPVGDGFRTFRTVVTLPDAAPSDAAFKLTVEADGRPVYTATVKAGDPPRELSLNVADAKSLRFTVERARPWVGDRLLLGDARFQK